MLAGARVFTFIVFFALGASFIATTASLIYEFQNQSWLDFLSFDSHLFVFFPTLGLVALTAFYIPASVFVDLYWRHVPYGKIRFIFGFLVVAAASYTIAHLILDNPRRAYWEAAPAALAEDKGEPAGCNQGQAGCLRMPVLAMLHDLREVGQHRVGLEAFVRDCARAQKDPLIEKAPAGETRRFCFASTPLSLAPKLQTNEECCKAQERMIQAVWKYYYDPLTRSMTSDLHAVLLPLKAFFLLVMFLISVVLAIHHKKVERFYPSYLPQIEVGVFMGAIAMLFFPLMSQAFLQGSDAVSGTEGRGTFSIIVPYVSLLFMVWTLLIGLFFYRRRSDDRLVTAGRFIGILVSNIGIIKYSLLISVFAWALGAGATEISLLCLVAFALVAIVFTIIMMVRLRPGRVTAAKTVTPALSEA